MQSSQEPATYSIEEGDESYLSSDGFCEANCGLSSTWASLRSADLARDGYVSSGHVSPARDVSPGRDVSLFGPIHLRAGFRGFAPKAGAYFLSRFRPPGWPGVYFICHELGVACLRVLGVMQQPTLSLALLRGPICIVVR